MSDFVGYKLMGNVMLPFPLPSKYDPSGPYNNPGGTMPGPGGSSLPASVWNGSRNMITWTTVADVNDPVEFTASWSTPVFDMRPDLGSVSENRSNITGAKPLWNPSAQIWVQFTLTDEVALSTRYSGLEIIAQEWAHVINLQEIAPVTDLQDVTAEFTNTFVDANGNNNSLLGWYPIGDGNPVRYYQLRLTLNLLRAYDTTPPMIYIQGSAY